MAKDVHETAVRVGIGGWDFDPWRGTFYPAGLPKARQLEFASRALTAIEINATYYKLQSTDLFVRWGRAVPEGFQFAIKASRFCTNRKRLGEGGEAIAKFCRQGFTELGDKLGPILWQFMGTKQFDAEDFQAFLDLLPRAQDGVRLRHAVEPRHESFRDPRFVAMAREAGVAIVFADADAFPCIADISGDFVYARLQRSREAEPAGYAEADLDRWAIAASSWARGESPGEFPYCAPSAPVVPRDVYMFVISGAKVRAPAAAQALIARLSNG